MDRHIYHESDFAQSPEEAMAAGAWYNHLLHRLPRMHPARRWDSFRMLAEWRRYQAVRAVVGLLRKGGGDG